MDIQQKTWQAVANSLSDSIFVVKEDASFHFVNDFACQKLGYSRDELTQMTVMQIGSEYEAQEWRDAWNRFHRERVVRFESKHRDRDGHEYPVLISTNFNDQTYDFPVVIAHAQDISESVFNRRRLQQAVQSAGLGFWDIEISTGKVYASPELYDQLGQSHEVEWSVDFWKSLLHPEDIARTLKHLDDFQAGLVDEYCVTFRIRHTDGSYRWIESRGGYVRSEHGSILRFMGTHLDVTEQKRTEQQLRETLRRSEKTQQSLNRSNQDLEQFAYVASHDLRAPLRSLKHLAEWIAEDAEELDVKLPDVIMQHLKKMQEQVGRMDSLLAGLLEYSRVGKRQQMLRETDLGSVIADAVELSSVPDKFEVLNPDYLPTWTTGREVLVRVFQNLLDNAVKHHDQDSGTIRIACVEDSDDFVFSVIDDGPGIAEKDRERVFEIFQTLKKNTSEQATGGLGLTIVNKLVQTVGGSIEVFGAKPRGAEFRFRWPKQLDYNAPRVPDNFPTT